MRERALALDGLSLAAVEYGDPDAPALLALHGWLDNAGSFAALAPQLLPHRRLIALDLPGHGRSGHLPGGSLYRYHFTDYVGAVLSAMDALDLPTVELLGHSLGAGIASLVAAAAPKRVAKLALIEGLGPLADESTQTLQRFRKSVARAMRPGNGNKRVFADIGAAIAARTAASGLPAEQARSIVERGTIASDDGLIWSSDARLTWPSPVRLAEQQIRTLLSGIDCPTWMLLAQPQTPYLPAATMRERAACVADIHVEHMDGGHHLHLEHPREVGERLLAFLD